MNVVLDRPRRTQCMMSYASVQYHERIGRAMMISKHEQIYTITHLLRRSVHDHARIDQAYNTYKYASVVCLGGMPQLSELD